MPEFLQEGRSGDLYERPRGPMVNDEALCFSCHDGSVVDSRARVFRDHGHDTGVPLSPEMEVEGILPLDERGRITCATCHTAHGTDMSRTSISNAIFLRLENTDSQLCMTCHTDKDHGIGRGDHPVAVDFDGEWPEALTESHAQRGQQHDVVCQSCHAAHGSPQDDLLVLPMGPAGLCSTRITDARAAMPTRSITPTRMAVALATWPMRDRPPATSWRSTTARTVSACAAMWTWT
jgi:predicted CXXCH cytochrome family protein